MILRIPGRLLVALLLSLAPMLALAAEALVAPPGYSAPAGGKGGGSFSCPTAPAPFSATLDFPSKYEGSGKARDQINEEADSEYKARSKPITDFEKGVNKIVAKYLETGSSEALRCALDWYGAWADGHGLLGEAKTHTGKSARKWALASASGAWLHLVFSASKPLDAYPDQARRIDTWLGQIGDRVMGEWDVSEPPEKINNHFYWAGWAAMATGVALNRRDLFDWAVSVYRSFASQADSDGYLPNELRRETRALGYHNFAITPIAMMAAFGKANGVDLPNAGNGALSRVANRVLQGFDDPGVFEAKSGFKQALEGMDEQQSKLAWLEPYCWSVGCSGAIADRLAKLRPVGNTRLGGNMTAVFGSR